MARSNPHYPPPQAIWLREKIPAPLLILSIIGVPIISASLFGAIATSNMGGVIVTFLGGVLPLLFFYADGTGLKLAWDEQRIYMRPQSFRPPSWRQPWLVRLPWRSLRYDEIASMDGVTINDPAAQSALLPFQLLCLAAADAPRDVDERDMWLDERRIWLYSLALRDKELAPLLRHMNAKCPDMLPEVVLERLTKWADNDK